jgi:serine/threonine-protein kinase ATR
MRRLDTSTQLAACVECSQITAIALSRDTIPLHITSPYMTELAPFVVSRIVTHPSLLKEVSRLMHQGSRAFVENSLWLTLPTLYIEQNLDVLCRIAEWLDRDLWDLTTPYIHDVLARIYLIPDDQDMQNSVKFMISILADNTDTRFDIGEITSFRLDSLIKTMVIAAGEEEPRRRQEVHNPRVPMHIKAHRSARSSKHWNVLPAPWVASVFVSPIHRLSWALSWPLGREVL